MKRVAPLCSIDTSCADDESTVPPSTHSAGRTPLVRGEDFTCDDDKVMESSKRSTYDYLRSDTFRSTASSTMLNAVDQRSAKVFKTNEQLDQFDL